MSMNTVNPLLQAFPPINKHLPASKEKILSPFSNKQAPETKRHMFTDSGIS